MKVLESIKSDGDVFQLARKYRICPYAGGSMFLSRVCEVIYKHQPGIKLCIVSNDTEHLLVEYDDKDDVLKKYSDSHPFIQQINPDGSGIYGGFSDE